MTAPEMEPGHGNIKAPDAAAEPWVMRFVGLIPANGPVLDLAAGGGRNGRLFLARGHAVTFIDRKTDALADLAGAPEAEVITADIESGPPPFGPQGALAGRSFAGAVCVNYLHRPLLAALAGALAPGGVMLYSTFMAGNEKFGRPSNPDYLLRPGELRAYAAAHGMDTAAFEEGPVGLSAARPGTRPGTLQDGAGTGDEAENGAEITAVRQSIAAVKRAS